MRRWRNRLWLWWHDAASWHNRLLALHFRHEWVEMIGENGLCVRCGRIR